MSTKQAVFQLNGEEYGLDINKVNTIEKDLVVSKMASLPKNVKGKIKLRGEEIPVYSLRRKFGIPDKDPDKDTRYLITDVKDMHIAIEVDNVKGIKDIEQSEIFNVPEVLKSNNTSYIKSIANIDGELILLLDNDMLLDNGEMKALKEIKSR